MTESDKLETILAIAWSEGKYTEAEAAIAADNLCLNFEKVTEIKAKILETKKAN